MKKIYLATKSGDILELGKMINHRVSIDELKKILSSNTGYDLFVSLDIFYDYQTLTIGKDLVGNEIVIYKAKLAPYMRFASILIENPFEDIINDKHVMGVYIPRNTRFSHNKNYRVIELDINVDYLLFLIANKLPRIIAYLLIKFWRLAKFSIVGFTGFIVNLTVLYLATYTLTFLFTKKIAIPIASIISFETSLTWNYILHEYWTFRDLDLEKNRKSLFIRWMKFHVGSIGSFITQVSFITLLSAYFGYPLYLSLFIGVVTGLLLNYLLSKTITWRK